MAKTSPLVAETLVLLVDTGVAEIEHSLEMETIAMTRYKITIERETQGSLTPGSHPRWMDVYEQIVEGQLDIPALVHLVNNPPLAQEFEAEKMRIPQGKKNGDL